MGEGHDCQREWGDLLMAELLTTDTELQTVANAIRAKTGGSANLGYPDGFASAIAGIGADCNAAAGDIRSGKTAYVGNAKVIGTATEKSAATYNVSSSDQTIAANQFLTGAQTIRRVTTSNIDAGNIKKGVVVKVGDAADDDRIVGVMGTYTSDANAGAGDILSGKTAYVNGSKITGNIPSQGATTYNASTSDQTISSGRYLSGNQTIRRVTTTNLSAANIKKGVTVQVGDSGSATRVANVTGTCVPVSVSLSQSGDCYIPFMFKGNDTKNVRFYWDANGFRMGTSDTGNKQFRVPCPIKITLYAESTSSGTTSITLQPGYDYWLNKVNDSVASITGSGISQSIWKITKFEQA